ncbi:hypothetical protein [Hymenobacter antarcticus]|uniref:Uncharacterized protein n=1 Tax=Hymenobacter antarcticus TaxID=486270 RepID=A0ABP7QC09_9BACT
MLKSTPFATSSAPTWAAQEAYLAIEQKPRDEAEKRLLEQARAYVQAHTHQADLRDLAPALRELMGAGYLVGGGGSHVWMKRAQGAGDQAAPERLAIVADRLTTAYRDWFESKLPTGPRRSSRPEQGHVCQV